MAEWDSNHAMPAYQIRLRPGRFIKLPALLAHSSVFLLTFLKIFYFKNDPV